MSARAGAPGAASPSRPAARELKHKIRRATRVRDMVFSFDRKSCGNFAMITADPGLLCPVKGRTLPFLRIGRLTLERGRRPCRDDKSVLEGFFLKTKHFGEAIARQ